MSTELTMPKLGLTMKTGKVARWLVAEGASVHQGDEIFEVETDKITNKIECPADGVLLQILVPQGEVVEVGTVLGLLGEAGEAVATKPATAAPEAQAEAAPEAAAPAAQAPVKAAGSYILATPRAKALARFLEMDLCFVTPTGRNGRIREADVLARQDVLARIAITPLARVLASQAGLDICTLTGTGEGGKIVKADVERALNPEAAAAAEAVQPEAAAEESVRAIVLEEGGGSFARELSATLDMTACLALLADLKRLGALYKKRADVLGIDIVVALAVARTLANHPALNAVYANGELKTSKKVDLLLRAGAADTGFVLGNAAALGILALADAKKAQSQGSSTCAFTSFAATRIERATPSLVAGQAAGLTLGSVHDAVCVLEGAPVVRKCAELVLSYDARLVSEEAACAFMDELVSAAESPLQLVF